MEADTGPAGTGHALTDAGQATRMAGRGLRPAPDYQARIDTWLRP